MNDGDVTNQTSNRCRNRSLLQYGGVILLRLGCGGYRLLAVYVSRGHN